MKSVLISIQPKWCELIASGSKTIEVRKTKPNLKVPFKCYIYCTKDSLKHIVFDECGDRQIEIVPQKVIGEFVCDKIFDIFIRVSNPDELPGMELPRTCLTDKEVLNYLGNGKYGYGWHISNLVIYDEPKPLWSFMKCGAPSEKDLDEELCSYCEQTEWGDRRSYGTPTGPVMCEGAFCGEAYDLYLDENYALKRPPQSWCYVEEMEKR